MRTLRWLTSGLVLLAIASAPARAIAGGEKPAKADKPKAGKKDKPPTQPKSLIQGYWAILASELQLTDEQKAKLEEALKNKNEANAAWNKEKGTQYNELNKALQDAKKNKNEQAIKDLNEKLQPLRQEKEDLDKKCAAEIDAVFTAEQLTKRKELDFYHRTIGRFAKAQLTDEQKAEARKLCQAAQGPIEQAKGKDRQQLQQQLHESIEKLLTDEQREMMTRKPEPKPAKAPNAVTAPE